jgi:hypothetical protein
MVADILAREDTIHLFLDGAEDGDGVRIGREFGPGIGDEDLAFEGEAMESVGEAAVDRMLIDELPFEGLERREEVMDGLMVEGFTASESIEETGIGLEGDDSGMVQNQLDGLAWRWIGERWGIIG